MSDALLRFWGKARPCGDAPNPWHPLLYHSLDVAAAGEALLMRDPGWLDPIAAELGTDGERLRPLLLFLLALHDIGKMSRPFQAKAPEHWPDVLGKRGEREIGPRHDEAGLALLAGAIEDALKPVLGNLRRGDRRDLLAPFMGHHGRPVRLMPNVGTSSLFGDEGLAAARAFVEVMHDLFRPSSLEPLPKGSIGRVSWRLAGLATLADWIGSSQAWFPSVPRVRGDEPLLPLLSSISVTRAADLAIIPASFVPATTDSRHRWTIYPNLARRLVPATLNQLWAAGITYVRLAEAFACLAVALDACSRRTIGWAMADHLRAELALEALRMALASREVIPGGLIHHSDRGVQYACGDHIALLGQRGIQPSMSRAGCPCDNAMAESFMQPRRRATTDCPCFSVSGLGCSPSSSP